MPRQEDNRWPRIRGRIIVFFMLALILLLSYNLTMGQYGFLNMMQLQAQISELDREEVRLNTDLVDLEYKRFRLKSDTLFIEKLARKNCQLSRPGEHVIEY
jgi:cell division protein FtsB